ncbi:MAG TPA: SDR family oxidoreductase, partial [Methylomirabilota bacterium]
GGGKAFAIVADVTKPKEIDSMIDETVKRFGRLDFLHNNAFGLPTLSSSTEAASPVGTLSDTIWDQMIEVGLTAVFKAIRKAIPIMRSQGSGAIVNTASISGLRADYGIAAYNAAKAGVINLTRSAAIENAKYGIRVNCVCPGTIDTRAPQLLGGDRADEIRREQAAANPVARMGQADEIANAIFFLASDESSFITGAAITADGGLTAHTGLPPFRRLTDSA